MNPRLVHAFLFTLSVVTGVRGQSSPQRWAILSTPAVQESALPHLLTAKLAAEAGLTLVERDQIAAVTKELTLDQALGADAAGQRLKLGKLLKADALLFLAEEQHDQDRFIRVVISDSAFGARLSIDFLPFNAGAADKLGERIVALVRDTRRRFPQGVQGIIGVPSFVSRDLTHDYDYLQDQLAYVLQNGLAAWPGQAVLEVEEARAIQRELDIAGDKLAQRAVPCFIEGEYRTTPAARSPASPAANSDTRPVSGLTTAPSASRPTADGPTSAPTAGAFVIAGRRPADIDLTLVVKDAGGVRQTVQQHGDTIEALAAWLQREAPQRLLGSAIPRGAALAEKEQLALLAARAQAFARLGDLHRAIGLREAALLIWPDDADQRRALLSEYAKLLGDSERSVSRGDADSASLRRTADQWRTVLAHLEYAMRHRLLTRGQVLTILDIVRDNQQAVAGQTGLDRPGGVAQAGNEWQQLAAGLLAQAEIERRRFVLEVMPLMDNLADDRSSQFVFEAPEMIRQYVEWGPFMDEILYLPPGSALHAWRQGRPFPHDDADLQYILQVLRRVARGRAELVPFMPEHVLAREFVPWFKPAYTDAQLDAFIAALCASDSEADRFIGQVCQTVRDFARSNPRDATATRAAVQRLAELEGEHLPRLSVTPVDAWRDGLERIRAALPRVAAGEDIMQPRQQPSYQSPRDAPVPPPEFDVEAVPLRFHSRAEPKVAVETTHALSGVLPCDDRFDVFWHESGFVALHLKAGELWTTAMTKERIEHVAWDGQFIWIAQPDKLIALNEDGDIVAEVGAQHGLLPHERGLALAGVAPGRALVVGSLGPEARAWCALVTVAEGGPSVRVFHEATRVRSSADPEWLVTVDPTLAFSPGRIHRFTPPNRPGAPLWIVERRLGSEGSPWIVARHLGSEGLLCPHHLLIDLEKATVGVLPVRHPDADGQMLGVLRDGSYLAYGSRGGLGAGPLRWVPAFGRRDVQGGLVRPLGLSWESGDAAEVLTTGGRDYFWCGASQRTDTGAQRCQELYTLDAESQSAHSLGGAPPSAPTSQGARGVSALLGLITWDQAGRVSRIVPHVTQDRGSLAPEVAAPDEHAAPATPAMIPVGGIVRDAAGRPLAGAQVYLLDNHPPELVKTTPEGAHELRTIQPYDYLSLTDAEGRWQENLFSLPRDRLWIRVGHSALSEHALEYRKLNSLQVEALLHGALEWSPPTQLVLAGRVLGPNDKPIERASVSLTCDPVAYRTVKLSELTDPEGGFRFEQPPAGIVFLVVQAPGWAPEARPVYVEAGTAAVEFRLDPARTLRARVVDEGDQPVSGARVSVYRWFGRRDLQWSTTTDGEGRFVWDQAPASEVWYTVDKEGFDLLADLPLAAGPDEHVVHFRRSRIWTIHGNVTDADTGAPIAPFAVSDVPLLRIPPPNLHSPNMLSIFQTGAYRTAVTDRSRPPLYTPRKHDPFPSQAGDQALWFIADGYVLQRQTVPTDRGTDIELDIRLKRSAGLRGTVRRLDGAPVPDASIGLASQAAVLQFINEMEWNDAKSDAEGHFSLPMPGSDYLVSAAHKELGLAVAPAAEFEATGELVLQPWGRIEGVCQVGAAEGACEAIQLDWPPPEGEQQSSRAYITGRWETRTDARGRFTIERLPPGVRLELRRCIQAVTAGPYGIPDWHYREVRAQPGQTVRVMLDRLGRPLLGRVTRIDGTDLPVAAFTFISYLRPTFPEHRPPEYTSWDRKQQLDWDNKFRKSPEGVARMPIRRYYMPELTADGILSAADVLPGSYWLEFYGGISGWEDGREWYAEAEFRVPPPPDPSNPAPLDLGKFVLRPRPEEE